MIRKRSGETVKSPLMEKIQEFRFSPETIVPDSLLVL